MLLNYCLDVFPLNEYSHLTNWGPGNIARVSQLQKRDNHQTVSMFVLRQTSDIGLTESVGDSGDTFELWFRKRTPGSTFMCRASSSHVCADWVRDISRLLWKQTMRNRERRLKEMACLGVGSKPSLDLKKSDDNINDRFVDVSLMHRGNVIVLRVVSLTVAPSI